MAEHDCAVHKSNGSAASIPNVMIVSPVLLYREGLSASLTTDGRIRVVAITDPAHALAEADICTPDVTLFDASGDGALAMAKQLKRARPGIILVGFGISNTADAAVACAEAGLAGFIDENASIDLLVDTTLNALRGECHCSPRVTAMLCGRLALLADAVGAGPTADACTLTPRERQIASLVSEGLSNKEIARDLRIGPATVKNHVHNILDKLGVRRRAAIAAWASEAP